MDKGNRRQRPMIIYSDQEIGQAIKSGNLKPDEYIIIDDLGKCDDGLLDFNKIIFARNLEATKVNCNTNSKVLFQYLSEKGVNISIFLKKYNLRDESFYLNYLEWMSAEETIALYNAVQDELSRPNPRYFMDIGKYAAETKQNLHSFIYLFLRNTGLNFVFELLPVFNRSYNNIVSVQYVTSSTEKDKLRISLIVKTFMNFYQDWDIKHFFWFGGNLWAIPFMQGYKDASCKYSYYAYDIIRLLKQDYAYLKLDVREANDQLLVNGDEYARKVLLNQETIKCNYSLKSHIISLISSLLGKSKYSFPGSLSILSEEDPVIYNKDITYKDDKSGPYYEVTRDLFDPGTGEIVLKKGEIFNTPYFKYEIEINLKSRWNSAKKLRTSENLSIYLNRMREQFIELEKTRNIATEEAEKAKKSEIAVRQLNKKLMRMDKLKDDFLAHTTHELRGPLTGIIGIAEMLLTDKTVQKNEMLLKNLSIISSSSIRLSSLVNDILDYSRLKYNDIRLQRSAVNLKTITDIVFEIIRPLINEKEIELVNSIRDIPPANADRNRLQQVLLNLLENAVKFTKSGTISVDASCSSEPGDKPDKDMIIITVSDSGSGIPDDKLDVIFNSFEKADESAPGTGLGLAIVKKLVELHGGYIKVLSIPGKGSDFIFTIPAFQTYISASPVSLNEKAVEKKPGPFSSLLKKKVTIEPLKGNSGKVIIIDDEIFNLQVMNSYFSTEDYSVVFSSDPKEALEIINKEEFDLVLLDIMMPHISGLELCRLIRKNYSLYELPVMILTVKNSSSDLNAGFAAGANDYLIKPVNKKELLVRANTLITLKQSVSRNSHANFKRIQEKIKPNYLAIHEKRYQHIIPKYLLSFLLRQKYHNSLERRRNQIFRDIKRIRKKTTRNLYKDTQTVYCEY